MKVAVSVVIVNYNTASLVSECIRSVRETCGEAFECIVVDSGSSGLEVERLREFGARDTRLIFFRDNVGYAKAVNAGVACSRGTILVITNPDVLFMPGSIESMAKALDELPDCGAAGPRTWWDRDTTFLLPKSELVTPASVLRDAMMFASAYYSRLRLRRWLDRNLAFWSRSSPSEEEMLSGACFTVRRMTWKKTGGFDEAFPLYYEDTDWCLRARRSGYRLYMVPDARIIHYYNQSARQDTDEASRKFNRSMTIYMNKHFRRSFGLITMLLGILKTRKPGVFTMTDLGGSAYPPALLFRDDGERLLILTPVPSMIPAAGAFIAGRDFRLPGPLWKSLGPGRYYCMSFPIGSFRPDGAWTWVKESRDNEDGGEGLA